MRQVASRSVAIAGHGIGATEPCSGLRMHHDRPYIHGTRCVPVTAVSS